MKKLILILIICTLSGCGLFRKTVKNSQSSSHSEKIEKKEESKDQVSADISGESSVKSSEQKQDQRDINEQTTLTADEIEIKPDGSIKAKGGAKLGQNKKDKGISNENKALERTDKYEGHIDSSSENKAQGKQESKESDKESTSQSEPKGSMMIWGGLGVLVIIIGLLLFFGFRPKNPTVKNKTTG